PAPAPKERSLVPVAVGVVVVLAAGGAWVALSGGEKKNAVLPDTAAVRPNTQNADSGRRGSGTPAVRNSRTLANHDSASKPRFDLAAAGHALNQLLDSIDTYPTSMVRDSARALFDARGIAANDKAFAAFVVGNTYFKAGDRSQGCSWV